jgi:hypothetical protein
MIKNDTIDTILLDYLYIFAPYRKSFYEIIYLNH